jgi:glycosyltransferase involved in cell wall biosynthesis
MRILLAGLLGGSSGIERYTRILGQELARRGHTVVVADPSGGAVAETPQGTRLASLPRPASTTPLARPFEGFRIRRRIGQLARTMQADVVHATHLELIPSSGARLVVTAWDPEATIVGRAFVARRRGLDIASEVRYAMSDGRACRRADAVIAVSHDVETALSGSVARVVTIPPFLPDEEVGAPRRSRSLDCVMVANGIDSARKGLDLAIAAVGQARTSAPDMRLVLVGSWHDPSRAKTLPRFCEVRGRLPQSEIWAVLRRAGCCIVPSRWEEFGYAGLEALAAGSPVVCGPLPGLTELRTSGVLAVGAREPAAFARRLNEAVALRGFAYPREALASHAVPRILDAYARDPEE